MMFANLETLEHYIVKYCISLFRQLDDELVPSIVLFDEQTIPQELKLPIHQAENYGIYYSDFFGAMQKNYVFVMQFDQKAVDVYYKIPEPTSLKYRSLLDAIILETLAYINECILGLLTREDILEKTHMDLLRLSGRMLLQALLNVDSANTAFDKFNKISSLSYEKTFSEGRIILLDQSQADQLVAHKMIRKMVQFEEKIPLSSTRHIRKILELSNPEVYLLSDGEHLYSTVELLQKYDLTYPIFTIEFNSYASWQLSFNNNKLMQITHEEVFIPKPKISYLEFSHEVKKIFPELDAKKINNLYKLTLEAFKQVKGTIIVVSRNARSEAYRLRNQGFLIEAMPLTPNIIRSITNIDGAVLMDLDGYCHGIGVILDGIATEKGDPSRGARYNSAIRYVETITNIPNYSNCFAIVISEDGDVDMISKFLY